MIPKSEYRFSEKIMLQQEDKAGGRLEESHPALAPAQAAPYVNATKRSPRGARLEAALRHVQRKRA
jgi:hypothetical protein